MNRRTFLKTTGAVGTTPLRGDFLFAPSGAKIEHVVLVMMENRSFDHLLGWLPNADGKRAELSFSNKSGGENKTFELAPDFTGCSCILRFLVCAHSHWQL